MDDPNRPLNAVERMEREAAETLAAHRKPRTWHGLRPGTIVNCPNFRRGRRYVVAPDGSLRRVEE